MDSDNEIEDLKFDYVDPEEYVADEHEYDLPDETVKAIKDFDEWDTFETMFYEMVKIPSFSGMDTVGPAYIYAKIKEFDVPNQKQFIFRVEKNKHMTNFQYECWRDLIKIIDDSHVKMFQDEIIQKLHDSYAI